MTNLRPLAERIANPGAARLSTDEVLALLTADLAAPIAVGLEMAARQTDLAANDAYKLNEREVAAYTRGVAASIRTLSPKLPRAQVEKVAEAIATQRGDAMLFVNTLEGHKPGQHCEECDANREAYHNEATAALSALGLEVGDE